MFASPASPKSNTAAQRLPSSRPARTSIRFARSICAQSRGTRVVRGRGGGADATAIAHLPDDVALPALQAALVLVDEADVEVAQRVVQPVVAVEEEHARAADGLVAVRRPDLRRPVLAPPLQPDQHAVERGVELPDVGAEEADELLVDAEHVRLEGVERQQRRRLRLDQLRGLAPQPLHRRALLGRERAARRGHAHAARQWGWRPTAGRGRGVRCGSALS